MTTPDPLSALGMPLEIISPEGAPRYLNPYTLRYTASKSYAERMQRGYARGLSQQESRGKRAGREYEQRKSAFEARYGFTPQYWDYLRRNWINEINRRAWRNAPSQSMQFVNGQRADPRIFPSDITQIKTLYDSGYRDPVYPNAGTWMAWAEERLYERLQAILDYQVNTDKSTGRDAYYARAQTWLPGGMFTGALAAASAPPIELWWYH